MISQPVVPRIPLALQASAGITIDPVAGTVTLNPAALSPASVASLLSAVTASLPNADPHAVGVWWNNGGIPSISQG